MNARQLASLKFPKVEQAFIAFKGGLDLETPPLFVASGSLREVQNYECDVLGGYKTLTGYERFDGRPAPSAANYATINVTITGTFAAADTITGVTSGATAVVIAVVTTTTPNYLAITKIVGTFVSGETLNVSAVGQGTTSSAATIDGASTALLHAQYKNLAADQYRNDIAVPPGSGNNLGGVKFSGTLYTWRNNAGGTAAAIFKSSAAGWVAVPTGSEISFTVGSGSVDEGDTLTQGGVTATIKRLVITSGTLAAGTAAGRLIIHTIAGGNYAAGAATTTGGGTLTLSAVQTLIAIAAGGSYKFIVENFGGSAGTKRVYGIDGANKGFEFDGTDYSYTPIATGMTSDIPTQIGSHKNHLFFAFPNGSVQHSGPGTPYVWSAVLGASEIGMGDTVTGFMTQPGSATTGAMVIFTRNRTSILYGTGVASWVLVPYRAELGAYTNTIQDIGFTVFLDDQGITNFQTAQEFGNFSHATLSEKIKTWLNTERTKVLSSYISRNKSQYRLFFSDQYALYTTFRGNKIIGMSQVYLDHQAKWVWSSEESDGSETIYFGSTDGMVYQMEKGTSFDGGVILHYMSASFDFLKSPRTLKHFKECMLEVVGSGYSSFLFSFELGYAATEINQPGTVTKTVSFSSGTWDASGAVWDALFWDGRTLSKTVVDLGGSAENISLMFRGSSDYDSPIRFSGAILHFIPRRALR